MSPIRIAPSIRIGIDGESRCRKSAVDECLDFAQRVGLRERQYLQPVKQRAGRILTDLRK